MSLSRKRHKQGLQGLRAGTFQPQRTSDSLRHDERRDGNTHGIAVVDKVGSLIYAVRCQEEVAFSLQAEFPTTPTVCPRQADMKPVTIVGAKCFFVSTNSRLSPISVAKAAISVRLSAMPSAARFRCVRILLRGGRPRGQRKEGQKSGLADKLAATSASVP